MAETVDSTAAVMAPFHMEIHKWITQHAPQHDDYAEYHAYCTNKIRRLKQQKDAKKYLTNSNKFVTFKVAPSDGVGGKTKRHAYCSRKGDTFAAAVGLPRNDGDATSPDERTDGTDTPSIATTPVLAVPHVNILWHLVVNAERSWANANEVQKAKGKRQTVLKKLKRAKEWADQLRIMATGQSSLSAQQPEVVDQATAKEIEAYYAWMSANYAMEKTDYVVREDLGLGC